MFCFLILHLWFLFTCWSSLLFYYFGSAPIAFGCDSILQKTLRDRDVKRKMVRCIYGLWCNFIKRKKKEISSLQTVPTSVFLLICTVSCSSKFHIDQILHHLHRRQTSSLDCDRRWSATQWTKVHSTFLVYFPVTLNSAHKHSFHSV